MRVTKTFTTIADESAIRERISSYLFNRGYKKIDDNSAIKFRRGSGRGSMFSFDPSKWDCVVTVNVNKNLDEKEVIVECNVDTTFQRVIIAEERFWAREIANLEKAVIKDGFAPEAVKKSARKLIIPGLVYLGVIICWVAISFGVAGALAILLRELFNTPELVGSLIMIFGGVLMMGILGRVWANWEENKSRMIQNEANVTIREVRLP